jgi:hypothetical protein
MRVEKREFAWEFSQLSCPGQTRTRVARELMRVEKREFAWEFSQLSCPGQRRTRVDESWQARVCMKVFSTLVPRSEQEQKLHESWWELSGYYRARSKNSHQLSSKFEGAQSCMKVHESGWELAMKHERESHQLSFSFYWTFSIRTADIGKKCWNGIPAYLAAGISCCSQSSTRAGLALNQEAMLIKTAI